MTDKIIKLGESILQHGKFNNRVYLMKLSKTDFPTIIDQTKNLAKKNGYTKVFAKVPKWAKSAFTDDGYVTEAIIPNFFAGEEDACFMSYYFDKLRTIQKSKLESEQIIGCAQKTQPINQPLKLTSNFSHVVLMPNDAEEMASIYQTVFETYPFSIFDPEYIRQTMQENIVYFGIRDQGKLVAVSSCEMDKKSRNVEMTDFATLLEYRSKGLASFLLSEMEREMIKEEIITAYTIARSTSYGMNISFAKHRYQYCGTLINNTNISGSIESMNVWYKAL
ncbi:MAG: putative beta-lysine N-acetyltransferase [Clostridia bacterium]|nr:putative beta-lysine N-acetyltransferase [Clostridia bacterium]MDD4049079.1 putative beta-lysine N-acetyltransferase [Clostridia bacterium]